MPVMSGLEATRSIRELGLTLPIIGLSANADDLSRKGSADAGMTGFLSKPMKMIDLKLAIEKCLTQSPRQSFF